MANFKRKARQAVAKSKQFIEGQQLKAEERRIKREFREKLDREALIEDAKKAELELKQFKQEQTARATIRRTREVKQKARGPSRIAFQPGAAFTQKSMFGSGEISGGLKIGGGGLGHSGGGIIGSMFGPAPSKATPSKAPVKRKKRRTKKRRKKR